MKVLDSLRRDGVSLVIATQDPRLLQLTHKVVVLNGGAVQSISPSADLARLAQGQTQGGATPNGQQSRGSLPNAGTHKPAAQQSGGLTIRKIAVDSAGLH